MDISFIFTLILASIIMVVLMALGVAITMPFHGALVRLRANYNPRAVGLEGVENRWVHRSVPMPVAIERSGTG